MKSYWRGGLFAVLLIGLAVGWVYRRQAGFVPEPGSAQHNQSSLPVKATTAPSAKPDAVLSAKAKSAFDDASCQELAQTVGAGSNANSGPLQQSLAAAKISAKLEVSALLQKAMNSPDLPQRTAALLLNAHWQADASDDAIKAKYPNCVKDADCERQMRTQSASARSRNFNEIARLAITSTDPSVYATAFAVCNYWDKSNQGEDVYCQQISASQWAERDPANGVAWLFAAQQAIKANKPAELDQAMFRLSQVKSFQLRRVGLPQLRDSFKLSQQNTLVQIELANLNNAAVRGGNSPQFNIAADYCKRPLLVDPNRRQICEGIANRLLEDRQILLSSNVGARIATRLDWPQPKIQQMMQEVDAIFAIDPRPPAPPVVAPDSPNAALKKRCFDSFFEARVVMESMEFGEIHGSLALLAKQPLSIAELARRYRSEGMPALMAKPED